MANRISAVLCCAALALSACAQTQVDTSQITYQPIFNKFGDPVGCEGGWQWDPSMPPGQECQPPVEECDPQIDPNCLPNEGEGGGDGQRRNPNRQWP